MKEFIVTEKVLQNWLVLCSAALQKMFDQNYDYAEQDIHEVLCELEYAIKYLKKQQ